MAKPKNAVPTVEKKVQIPMDLVTRMELELHSDLEGKIPYGAQSEFINRLIREHYQRIDSGRLPQAGCMGNTTVAQGLSPDHEAEL